MNDQKFGKILIVDDNEDLLKAAKIFFKAPFRSGGYRNQPRLTPNSDT